MPARIAWRYLLKKKSYGAVSAIAGVSVTGVAIATAAILCVLSVFNGFRDILTSSSARIRPDVIVEPARGKVIADGDSLAEIISKIPEVEAVMPAVEDQALVIFNGIEMPVMLRGVDPKIFGRVTAIDSLIIAGEGLPEDAAEYDVSPGLLSVGVGQRLEAYTPGENPLFLFAPRREGRINPNNPLTSFFTDSVVVAGVFRSEQSEYDATSIYVPIEVARGLFQYDTEATSLQIKARRGHSISETAAAVASRINGSPQLGEQEAGNAYVVKDRGRMDEISFRMVEIEKWVSGLLLLFILIIASFNIISTMTMFVLEKRRSLATLRAVGMTKGSIGAVFAWESLYVSLSGGAAGILLGMILIWLQQQFGLITIDGGMAGESIPYPVKFMPSDIWPVVLAVVAIGIITALISASFARSRIVEKRQ